MKKNYFRMKPYQMNNKGNFWAMYKDNDKTKFQ